METEFFIFLYIMLGVITFLIYIGKFAIPEEGNFFLIYIVLWPFTLLFLMILFPLRKLWQKKLKEKALKT